MHSDAKSPVEYSATLAGFNVSKHEIYQSWNIPTDVLDDFYHVSLSGTAGSHCKYCVMKPLSLVVITQAMRILELKKRGPGTTTLVP